MSLDERGRIDFRRAIEPYLSSRPGPGFTAGRPVDVPRRIPPVRRAPIRTPPPPRRRPVTPRRTPAAAPSPGPARAPVSVLRGVVSGPAAGVLTAGLSAIEILRQVGDRVLEQEQREMEADFRREMRRLRDLQLEREGPREIFAGGAPPEIFPEIQPPLGPPLPAPVPRLEPDIDLQTPVEIPLEIPSPEIDPGVITAPQPLPEPEALPGTDQPAPAQPAPTPTRAPARAPRPAARPGLPGFPGWPGSGRVIRPGRIFRRLPRRRARPDQNPSRGRRPSTRPRLTRGTGRGLNPFQSPRLSIATQPAQNVERCRERQKRRRRRNKCAEGFFRERRDGTVDRQIWRERDCRTGERLTQEGTVRDQLQENVIEFIRGRADASNPETT